MRGRFLRKFRTAALRKPLPDFSHKRFNSLVVIDVDWSVSVGARRHVVFVSPIPDDNCCARWLMFTLTIRCPLPRKLRWKIRASKNVASASRRGSPCVRRAPATPSNRAGRASGFAAG